MKATKWEDIFREAYRLNELNYEITAAFRVGHNLKGKKIDERQLHEFIKKYRENVRDLLNKEQEDKRSVATMPNSSTSPDPQNAQKEPVIDIARKIVSEWLQKNNTAVTLDGRFGGEFDANDLADTIAPYLKSTGEPVIDNLRDKFFNELCKYDSIDGLMFKSDSYPIHVFNWFKPYLKSNSEPVIDWEGIAKLFYDELTENWIPMDRRGMRKYSPEFILNWLKSNLTNYIK